MKVSNVNYPPNGVANCAIMLILMSLRKAGHILKRGEVQDYSLKGKIGRDISSCTVGVIGTGRIGQTVLKHLSGFGCRLLAYDLYPNQEVKKIAEYVPLETLLAESDVITLNNNATEENHHLLDAAAFAKMKPGVTIVKSLPRCRTVLPWCTPPGVSSLTAISGWQPWKAVRWGQPVWMCWKMRTACTIIIGWGM